MEEEFMTDDKESRLKSLRERMMLWLLINLVRKECEFEVQVEERTIAILCCTREYRQIQDIWRDAPVLEKELGSTESDGIG